MGKGFREVTAVLVCFALIIALAGCGKKRPPVDVQRMEELGNIFVQDIDEILVFRESPKLLTQMEDVLTETEDKTYNIDELWRFCEDYRVGQDTQLTIVFDRSNFVIIRLVFDGSIGYYYRYQLDQFNESAIEVASHAMYEIEVENIPDRREVKMTLTTDKQTSGPMTYTFHDIVQEE